MIMLILFYEVLVRLTYLDSLIFSNANLVHTTCKSFRILQEKQWTIIRFYRQKTQKITKTPWQVEYDCWLFCIFAK